MPRQSGVDLVVSSPFADDESLRGVISVLRGRYETRVIGPEACARGDDIQLPLVDRACPGIGFPKKALWDAVLPLRPRAVWIWDEPSTEHTRLLLRRWLWSPRPRLVGSVVENLFVRPPLLQRAKAWLLLRRLDALVGCASLSLRSAYQAFVPRRVPGHVLFWPIPDLRSLRRESFALQKGAGRVWVGLVGRIVEEKGWKVALDAIAGLPSRTELLVAGTGPDVGDLNQHVVARGLTDRVHQLGTLDIEHLAYLYSKLDLLVVPSLTRPHWSEQFGRVIGEAMAAGVPVVGSDSGAIPEVVGDGGLVVPEGNPSFLRTAIARIVSDDGLRCDLIRRGRMRFEREFSVEVYASRVARLLFPQVG